MKYLMLAVFVASTLCVPAFSKDKSDFQTATIVKVEKLGATAAAPSPAGYGNPDSPTDAQEGPRVFDYNLSVQVGDTIYVSQVKSYNMDNPQWAPGSQVQARVSKRTLYLKQGDEVVTTSILSKAKAASTEVQKFQ